MTDFEILKERMVEGVCIVCEGNPISKFSDLCYDCTAKHLKWLKEEKRKYG